MGSHGRHFCLKSDECEFIFHRENGPAVELYTGKKFWYYHGEFINCKDNEEFLKIIKMKVFL